jgi:Leucine Rich repeat
MGVVRFGQCVLRGVGVEKPIAGRAAMLRVGQFDVARSASDEVAEVVQESSAGAIAKTGLSTSWTGEMGIVATSGNDLRGREILGLGNASGDLRQILARTKHDDALLGSSRLAWNLQRVLQRVRAKFHAMMLKTPFLFNNWTHGRVAKLSHPDSPFALKLITEKVNDASLQELAELQNLHFFDLGYTSVTDKGIKELIHFKKLEMLCLQSTKISGVGLGDLAGLHMLAWVDLGNSRLSDDGLKGVAAILNLRTLDIRNTKVTNKGLAALSEHKTIKSLDLTQTTISKGAFPKCGKACGYELP